MVLLEALVINWSRAQFALAAIFHWFFVPFNTWIVFHNGNN